MQLLHDAFNFDFPSIAFFVLHGIALASAAYFLWKDRKSGGDKK